MTSEQLGKSRCPQELRFLTLPCGGKLVSVVTWNESVGYSSRFHVSECQGQVWESQETTAVWRDAVARAV